MWLVTSCTLYWTCLSVVLDTAYIWSKLYTVLIVNLLHLYSVFSSLLATQGAWPHPSVHSHVHTMMGPPSGFRVLPKGTSACRLEEPGVEPSTWFWLPTTWATAAPICAYLTINCLSIVGWITPSQIPLSSGSPKVQPLSRLYCLFYGKAAVLFNLNAGTALCVLFYFYLLVAFPFCMSINVVMCFCALCKPLWNASVFERYSTYCLTCCCFKTALLVSTSQTRQDKPCVVVYMVFLFSSFCIGVQHIHFSG